MGDANWFYSALAQSAAAIVGLAGALLLNRIAEISNAVRDKKAEIISLRNALRKQSLEHTTKIEALEKKLGHILKDTEKNIENKKTGSQGYGMGDGFNNISLELGKPEEVETVRKGLEMTLTNLGKLNDFMRNFDNSPGENVLYAPNMNEDALLISESFNKDLNYQVLGPIKDFWYPEFSVFEGLLRDYQEITIPKSYYVVLITLAFIFIVGVIIPLSYLPGESARVNSGLLVLFSFGVLGLMGYFVYLVHEIRSV